MKCDKGFGCVLYEPFDFCVLVLFSDYRYALLPKRTVRFLIYRGNTQERSSINLPYASVFYKVQSLAIYFCSAVQKFQIYEKIFL